MVSVNTREHPEPAETNNLHALSRASCIALRFAVTNKVISAVLKETEIN